MSALLRTVALACALTAACSGRGDDPTHTPDVAAPSADAQRLEGQVRIADRWEKVAPLVLHDGKMDLATRCRILRDEAKGKGEDVPLCYDTNRRPERRVTTITVERDLGLARAMRRLTARSEGVHFLVDRSGAIYQVLDLAYAPRHDGAYPEGEVRIVACNADAERALIDALRALFPEAKVSTHDLSKEAEP